MDKIMPIDVDFGLRDLTATEVAQVSGGRAAEYGYNDVDYEIDVYASSDGSATHNFAVPPAVLVQPVIRSS
jgi:hypothetical protein